MCGGIIVMCVWRVERRGSNYDMGKRVMVRATTVMSLNGDLQVLVCVCWVVTGTVWFLD